MASKKKNKNNKNKNKNQNPQNPKSAPEKELPEVEEDISPEEAYEAMMAEILPTVEEDPEGEIEFFDFSDIPDAPAAHHEPDPDDEELDFASDLPEEEASIVPPVIPVIDPEPELEIAAEEIADEVVQDEEISGEKDEESEPAPVPVIPMAKKAPLTIHKNPMIRSAAAFAGILAAAGLIVSTVHVLTGDAVRINEENSFNTSFAQLFPEASALKKYTTEDGTTVWLAVKDGEISGYCVEENGGLIGYNVDGEPVSGVKIGTGETLELPQTAFEIDLDDAASALGLSVIPDETEEPSANEDNGREEIVIGEAVEEGSETAEVPETDETEPAESDVPQIPEVTEPETEPQPVTEPAEPDVPVIADPVETTPQVPDVPVAEETAPETETQPVETEPETWWTPEIAPSETQPESQWTPETAPAETEPETWWTPETAPAETQPESQWTPETDPAETQPESEGTADSEPAETPWNDPEAAAEPDSADSDMTGDESKPAESGEPAETEPEISVEVEVEIEDPAEPETEETAPETEETKKKETKRSGSGLF